MKTIILIFCLIGLAEINAQNNTFTDPRDGEEYATVSINGRVWMAENVRYNVPGSVYNPKNPSRKYGRHYTWEQAKKACPDGWRLPTEDEFMNILKKPSQKKDTLSEYLDLISKDFDIDYNTSLNLRSESGWLEDDENSSGFNAFPAGVYENKNKLKTNMAVENEFIGLGRIAHFWATKGNESGYFYLSRSGGGKSYIEFFGVKDDAKSCRCIKK